MNETIKEMPMLPLREQTVLPGMALHFDISRERSIRAVEAAMSRDQKIFLITQRNPDDENPGLRDLYKYGTTAMIRNVAKMPKNIIRVMVEGEQRARLIRIIEMGGYLRGGIEPAKESETVPDEVTSRAMILALRDLLQRYTQMNQKFGKDMLRQLLNIQDLRQLVTEISNHIPIFYAQRQRLLEASDVEERYNVLSEIMINEMEIIQVRNEIHQKVRERIDKNQSG